MIFFFKNGRLGNQLFQYAALKLLYPDQKIIFFGCDDLIEVLAECSVTSFSFQNINNIISPKLLEKFFNLFRKVKLIGLIQEHKEKNNYYLKKNKGLIPNFFLVKNTFFQHKNIVDQFRGEFKIKPTYLRKAKNWLILNKVNINLNNLVFIHIRRGDYLSWPNLKSPAVLDSEWYFSAINRLMSQVKSPRFIILTDDYFYVNDVFGNQKNILISKNDLFVDLALMSLCSHGILSGSSFSWWGAWLSYNKKVTQSQIFIAPMYWAGHRSKKWEPEGFKSNWITYIK